jgi:hypothetical protein
MHRKITFQSINYKLITYSESNSSINALWGAVGSHNPSNSDGGVSDSKNLKTEDLPLLNG